MEAKTTIPTPTKISEEGPKSPQSPQLPRVLLYEKGAKSLQGESMAPELYFFPDAYVKSITVNGWLKLDDYYCYVLNIYGRSRFLQALPDNSMYVRYKAYARYSSLNEFHKSVQSELGPESPAFPSKKWIGNNDELANKRSSQLNEYFKELFSAFGNTLQFSQLVIDRFPPTPVDVTVAGHDKLLRHRFVNTLSCMQRSMQVTKEDSSSWPLCSIKPKAEYAGLLAEIQTKTKGWRASMPFDYLYREHLYRVDVKKGHTKTHPGTSFVPGTPVIFLVDATKEDGAAVAAEISKKARMEEGSVRRLVVASLTYDGVCRVISKDCLSKALKDTFGAQTFDRIVEVNLVTGDNVLKVLDQLLTFCFPHKKVAVTKQ